MPRQTMALSEFKDVVEDFSDELKEAGYGMEGGMGRGQGNRFRCRRPFLYEVGRELFDPPQEIPYGKERVPSSAFAFALGDWVPFSGCGYLDKFWKDYAGDHSDLDEKGRKGKGKDRRRPRIA